MKGGTELLECKLNYTVNTGLLGTHNCDDILQPLLGYVCCIPQLQCTNNDFNSYVICSVK